MTGSLRELHGRCGKPHAYLGTPVVEAACANQSATTVASRSREDEDPSPSGVAFQESTSCQMGKLSAGVLHHLDEDDIVVFYHRPVHFAHLVG